MAQKKWTEYVLLLCSYGCELCGVFPPLPPDWLSVGIISDNDYMRLVQVLGSTHIDCILL